MLTRRINRRENSNIEIRPFYQIGRNNIKIQMFKIQNKFGMVLSFSVYVIEISVI